MILHNISPVRVADDLDWSDLTASVQTGRAYWSPDHVDALVIPFDVEPTAAEAAAIRRRLLTVDADEEARVVQLAKDADNPNTSTSVRGLIRAELARYGG